MPTYLFTDIEASTRLWEEHPETMQSALARHDHILNDSIVGAGGTVLKTTGDGLVAVFETPRAAATAAIMAQRELQREPWEGTGPIRVRMGVHSGVTETREGDHFGPVMNRTARLMSAGHGGQVLVSAQVAADIRDDLTDGVKLIDLGSHRLKDLTLPEHLYQLTDPGLNMSFPPPRTLDSRPHNLPLQATEFLGREAELSTIRSLLASPGTRLLTITGPGGAGKTRLALQAAADLSDGFDDGVFFVDLSKETDPDAAFEAVVRTLDLPISTGGDSLQVLKTRLRDSAMLLVLDNLEQLTAAGTGISELLMSAPRVKLMVTSRETLKIRAEQVYPVPPLGLPHPDADAATIGEAESVQLFVDRARAVNPSFTLNASNAPEIAEICLRLDGLPLAIELAAARLNIFSPDALLQKLKDRLDILGSGGRDLPDRQRTLWGAIGWSYELLSEDECRLFEMMAVFSTATYEAIEEVASKTLGTGLVLDTLSSLVDKSLLRSDTSGPKTRFSMLLMIKEYAEDRLESQPELNSEVALAHADYYSAYAKSLHEQMRSENREDALAELSLEIGNLRSAWSTWIDRGDVTRLFDLIESLWALHEAKGWYHAAIDLASQALDALSSSEEPLGLEADEMSLRTALARALMAVHGYTPEVEQAYRRILEQTTEVGDNAQTFPVLRSLATFYMNTGEMAAAAEYGKRLLDIAEVEDDNSMRSEAHFVVGAGMTFSGDPANGLPHIERSIALFDVASPAPTRYRLGPSVGVSARAALGLILYQAGQLDQGSALVSQSLDVARRIDHPYSVAYALHHNAFLALMRELPTEALAFTAESEELTRQHDYMLWHTLAGVVRGVALAMTGDIDEGARLTESAIEIYQGLTSPPVFWPLLLNLRASVQVMAGNWARALDLASESVALGSVTELDNPNLRTTLGDVLLAQPEPRIVEAEEAYRCGASGAAATGMRTFELAALVRLVSLLRSIGVSPDGSDDLRAVYESFSEGHDESLLVHARELLGKG